MPDDPEMLRRFLAARDAPCPNCGYNLRGLPGRRCPECNEHLELRVGLAEPKLGALLGAAIGLGAGVGFNAMILAYFFWNLAVGSSFGPTIDEGAPLMASLAAIAGLLAALLSGPGRRWFRARRAHLRLGLAVGAWVASGASAVWFFATVA